MLEPLSATVTGQTELQKVDTEEFTRAWQGTAASGTLAPPTQPSGGVAVPAAAGLLMADGRKFEEETDQIFRDFLAKMIDRRKRQESTRLIQQMRAAEAVVDGG